MTHLLAAGEVTDPSGIASIVLAKTVGYPGSSIAFARLLSRMERAGLIEQGRQAQWRPCRLRAERLHDVADWIGQYPRHWEASFDRLDDYLRTLQQTEPQGDSGIDRPDRT